MSMTLHTLHVDIHDHDGRIGAFFISVSNLSGFLREDKKVELVLAFHVGISLHCLSHSVSQSAFPLRHFPISILVELD